MNKKSILLVLGFVVVFFVQGCAAVSYTPTGKIYPPFEGTVKIFKEVPNDVEYEELGWVTADGDFNHPWAKLLGMMQDEAAVRGANALIIEEKFTTRMDTEIQYGDRRYEDRTVTAIAIRIKE